MDVCPIRLDVVWQQSDGFSTGPLGEDLAEIPIEAHRRRRLIYGGSCQGGRRPRSRLSRVSVLLRGVRGEMGFLAPLWVRGPPSGWFLGCEDGWRSFLGPGRGLWRDLARVLRRPTLTGMGTPVANSLTSWTECL